MAYSGNHKAQKCLIWMLNNLDFGKEKVESEVQEFKKILKKENLSILSSVLRKGIIAKHTLPISEEERLNLITQLAKEGNLKANAYLASKLQEKPSLKILESQFHQNYVAHQIIEGEILSSKESLNWLEKHKKNNSYIQNLLAKAYAENRLCGKALDIPGNVRLNKLHELSKKQSEQAYKFLTEYYAGWDSQEIHNLPQLSKDQRKNGIHEMLFNEGLNDTPDSYRRYLIYSLTKNDISHDLGKLVVDIRRSLKKIK